MHLRAQFRPLVKIVAPNSFSGYLHRPEAARFLDRVINA